MPKDNTLKAALVIGGLWLASKLMGDGPGPPPLVITEPPTLTAQQLNAIVAGIRDAFEDFYGGEDEDAIIGYLWQCNNDADVAQVIDRFGTLCFYFGLLNCLTLPGAITAYFSDEDRRVLNTGLANKGIKFQF